MATNWETDPRPLSQALRAWKQAVNAETWVNVQALLCVSEPTLYRWLKGAECVNEPQIRRLMRLLEHYNEGLKK